MSKEEKELSKELQKLEEQFIKRKSDNQKVIEKIIKFEEE